MSDSTQQTTEKEREYVFRRLIACWKAFEGVEDPELELATLRAEVERLRGALGEALPVIDQLRQAATYTVMACSMTGAKNGIRMLNTHDESVKRHVEALRAALKGGA